ncbi:MAG: tRNA 2-thiouridine(34) synthase MnmA [Alphaproteobacteria bacterium]|nr:tRNA 2-thiouridine(34) synthase MnmA [Alphaproteobacteria bacterium]
MSGGVDSSVAAGLLVEAGYNVIGITLQLYDHGEMIEKKGSCCAGQDIYDARSVADKLGFPHYVLDYESIFKQGVMDDFADSYLRGETPIPCIRCNQNVKFRDLLKTAKNLGATCLVTGHYVQRVEKNGVAQMLRAVDSNRDQSYFLFTTTRAQLNYLRFPLGGMPKSETREHAKRFGLQVAEKPDSQDICFVPNGNYASVVERLRPGALDAGDIVHVEGRVLGQHNGIINYTIGQRKGLGISSPEPLFVIRLDPEEKRVVVGPKSALARQSLWVKELNMLADTAEFEGGKACTVKIRSSQEPINATVYLHKDGFSEVILETPEFGIANGQACVFYDGKRVLGGGWLTAR